MCKIIKLAIFAKIIYKALTYFNWRFDVTFLRYEIKFIWIGFYISLNFSNLKMTEIFQPQALKLCPFQPCFKWLYSVVLVCWIKRSKFYRVLFIANHHNTMKQTLKKIWSEYIQTRSNAVYRWVEVLCFKCASELSNIEIKMKELDNLFLFNRFKFLCWKLSMLASRKLGISNFF